MIVRGAGSLLVGHEFSDLGELLGAHGLEAHQVLDGQVDLPHFELGAVLVVQDQVHLAAELLVGLRHLLLLLVGALLVHLAEGGDDVVEFVEVAVGPVEEEPVVDDELEVVLALHLRNHLVPNRERVPHNRNQHVHQVDHEDEHRNIVKEI